MLGSRAERADLAAEAAPVAGDVLAQRLRSQQLHLGTLRLLHCCQQMRQDLCTLAGCLHAMNKIVQRQSPRFFDSTAVVPSVNMSSGSNDC